MVPKCLRWSIYEKERFVLTLSFNTLGSCHVRSAVKQSIMAECIEQKGTYFFCSFHYKEKWRRWGFHILLLGPQWPMFLLLGPILKKKIPALNDMTRDRNQSQRHTQKRYREQEWMPGVGAGGKGDRRDVPISWSMPGASRSWKRAWMDRSGLQREPGLLMPWFRALSSRDWEKTNSYYAKVSIYDSQL